MNVIYNIVWNYSLMAWTVVSELGKGRTKSSSSKITVKPRANIYITTSAVLVAISSNVYALDINGYTDFNSSTSISDGLQWNTTATVQVDVGADVTVSNSSGNSTLNMAPAAGGDTSLWINGGTLTANNTGSILMGNNSMLQVGGAQLGGLTSEQSGGSAGILSVGELTTSPGATDATIWMFGSSTSTAKLNADSIDLEADKNDLFIDKPNDSDLGADIYVKNDMTVINKSAGSFLLAGDSNLDVGGSLYLDTTNGSFLVSNDSSTRGINVGGDLTLTNNIKLSSDINSVSTSAGIYSAVVNVNGDINVIGKNVGNTGLQIINAGGTGVTTLGDFNISSTVSGNITDVIFGHGAKIASEKDINLNTVDGSAVNLYIGDSEYGAPTDISAKSITMSGDGDNKVIFNNNKPTEIGTDGYIFDVSINGSGSITQQSGHTTLSAESNYDGGTIIEGGLLSITSNKALGSSDVAINTDPSDISKGLDIAYNDGSDFTNTLSGSGNTTVSGDAKIVSNNSIYSGNWNVVGVARTAQEAINSHGNFGGGSINIIENGALIADTNNSFLFSNKLTGNGQLIAKNNGEDFNFSSSVGNEFSGEVLLETNNFFLNGDNTAALKNATLHIGNGNITTVGNGIQNIGGLALDGGILVFGDISPGSTASDNFVEISKNMDLTGKGSIQITDNNSFENTPHAPDGTRPLLQQDDTGVMVKLAGSKGTIEGNGGNLNLIDQSGNIISDTVLTDFTQGGETIAKGTYNYRLTSGDHNDGLYINYGLTKVELLAQGDNALTLTADGNTGNAADLSAQVIGSGDLRINTDTDISLSNSENSYTGATWVTAGGLKMGNDNVLGNTRLLNLADGTHLDINGYSQTLQNLNTEAGSTLDFNKGALTVNNGQVDGVMTGAGSLIVTGGALTISSDNANMSADTAVASDGMVRMLANQALGTGKVNNQGTIYLGQNDTVSGASIVAAQQSQYQVGELTNSGTVVIGHNDANNNPIAGTTLTVNGNYIGEDGHLQFNTVLGNDNSLTDKMVVTGDSSGHTGVSITNAGGKGDEALNGIEIISVGGDSAGEFTQDGRIVAGAYDYSLARGKDDNANNWYLVNNGSDPVDPILPVLPVDPVIPVIPVDPVIPQPDVRPEGGSYVENLAVANHLFNTTLHDRLGETQYIDALTGEKKITSLWLRQVGSHNSWRDGSGQLKTQSNSYVVQLGGDIAQWSSDGLDRGHLGLMAGYGNNHNNTHSSVTGYSSKGSINGYSAGIYGTWFANDVDKAGLYVDSWLQYSWFNNHVNGQGLTAESYKSKGFTASLESGYTFKIGEFSGSHGARNQWFIQPQAQATWMGVKADDHREANGTRVNNDGDGNVQTRLGLRTYLKSHHAMDESKGREFEPFIEANWLHNTRNFSATMDGARISQAGARNIGEVKVGVEGKINSRVNLWGNIGTQVGDKGYSSTSVMLGAKYNF